MADSAGAGLAVSFFAESRPAGMFKLNFVREK
jgi:hypothetical protein